MLLTRDTLLWLRGEHDGRPVQARRVVASVDGGVDAHNRRGCRRIDGGDSVSSTEGCCLSCHPAPVVASLTLVIELAWVQPRAGLSAATRLPGARPERQGFASRRRLRCGNSAGARSPSICAGAVPPHARCCSPVTQTLAPLSDPIRLRRRCPPLTTGLYQGDRKYRLAFPP